MPMEGLFDGFFEVEPEENNDFTIATGTIKEIYNDKMPGKVKVEISMVDGSVNVTDWIRVAAPYGGKDKGMYFLPDIGDEVVLAFERGYLEKPIVIGVLWNDNNAIPVNPVEENNNVKKIKTRGGHEIIFDDTKDKEKINIITPKKSEICIDDENAKITITAKGDDGDNIIKLDSKSGEITIQGNKKITLEAGSNNKLSMDGEAGSIKLECTDISLEATSSVKIKGSTISAEAPQISHKASGTLSLESTGNTSLKGTIVKIN